MFHHRLGDISLKEGEDNAAINITKPHLILLYHWSIWSDTGLSLVNMTPTFGGEEGLVSCDPGHEVHDEEEERGARVLHSQLWSPSLSYLAWSQLVYSVKPGWSVLQNTGNDTKYSIQTFSKYWTKTSTQNSIISSGFPA